MNRNENRCSYTEALNRYEREQEEAEEQRQHEENELFKSIEPYIDGLNNAIKFHAHCYGMSKAETAEYVRDTLANLIEG